VAAPDSDKLVYYGKMFRAVAMKLSEQMGNGSEIMLLNSPGGSTEFRHVILVRGARFAVLELLLVSNLLTNHQHCHHHRTAAAIAAVYRGHLVTQ